MELKGSFSLKWFFGVCFWVIFDFEVVFGVFVRTALVSFWCVWVCLGVF
jgi:hypothetical protein